MQFISLQKAPQRLNHIEAGVKLSCRKHTQLQSRPYLAGPDRFSPKLASSSLSAIHPRMATSVEDLAFCNPAAGKRLLGCSWNGGALCADAPTLVILLDCMYGWVTLLFCMHAKTAFLPLIFNFAECISSFTCSANLCLKGKQPVQQSMPGLHFQSCFIFWWSQAIRQWYCCHIVEFPSLHALLHATHSMKAQKCVISIK